MLALVISDARLDTQLNGLALYLEGGLTDGSCNVFLADLAAGVLRSVCAPTLPQVYVDSIDRVPIRVGASCSGTAAASRRLMVVDDIDDSDLPASCKTSARAHGVRACWSAPILNDRSGLLGVLAVYCRMPHAPAVEELDLVRFVADLAGHVIQRHKDNDNLRSADTGLRAAVAGADVGVWDSDADGAGVWFDDWCERQGIDPCNQRGQHALWCDQIHPDDRERYRFSDAECAHGDAEQYAIEYRVRTRGGRWRWLLERGSVAERHADGQPRRYVGICVNIDDRKSPAVSFSGPQERLKALARLVGGYILEGRFQADGQVEFTWADDAFSGIFGCERPEVNRRGWHNFVDPRDRATAARSLAAVASGQTKNIEIRIIGASGHKRWLRMAAEPLADPATGTIAGFIGMAEDITDRKVLMEQMLESVNREQRRIGNDLHDELGQVLTGASLLLRACHTRAVRDGDASPNDIAEAIDLVTGAIETTRVLAHGLAPGSLDGGGLASALDALSSRARRWSGLAIIVSLHPEPLARLDVATSEHLYRIVQEAMTNVARHAQAATVRIATRVRDNELSIEVSDDGVGIADSVAMGFGLRTMRYRANAIGAQLDIEAGDVGGTRVCITLPMRANA